MRNMVFQRRGRKNCDQVIGAKELSGQEEVEGD
jgi:hypothetical protein